MNEDLLKKIISVYIKELPEKIDDNSLIDNSVIQGSILFHRMISKINDQFNIELDHYDDLICYRDLLNAVKNKLS